MAKPVSFGSWLDYHGIDWNEGLCVNMATDGLAPGKDHLIAIGTQFPGEEPSYTYVQGAFPGKTEKFHGITMDHYASKWLGVRRVQEVLMDVLQDAKFLVVGNADFFKQWLALNEPPLTVFGDFPVFGLSDYAKFLDTEEGLYYSTGDTIDKITKLIRHNVKDMRYAGGYSMRSLYSRLIQEPISEEGIIFEEQTRELTRLYCAMLWV